MELRFVSYGKRSEARTVSLLHPGGEHNKTYVSFYGAKSERRLFRRPNHPGGNDRSCGPIAVSLCQYGTP